MIQTLWLSIAYLKTNNNNKKKGKILILLKNFQICSMHNLRETNYTYNKSSPFLGQKHSHIPLNLKVYLKGTVANVLCFW